MSFPCSVVLLSFLFVSSCYSQCTPLTQPLTVCSVDHTIAPTDNKADPDNAIFKTLSEATSSSFQPSPDCAFVFANFQCARAYPNCDPSKNDVQLSVCRGVCENVVLYCSNQLLPSQYNFPASIDECRKYSIDPACTNTNFSDISHWYALQDGNVVLRLPPPPGGIANGSVLGIACILMILLGVGALAFLMKRQTRR
eukprot:TRINITY_DN6243_c0_g1_i2.p1 TRINITY_DN6243_c0_g1~~TRINITY_DN6243_c0_g1_i2.p1  ORF type:complete len:214 (-),score=44.91 TRINITY_DN6243_c0_g1_i2:97-687(-)